MHMKNNLGTKEILQISYEKMNPQIFLNEQKK